MSSYLLALALMVKVVSTSPSSVTFLLVAHSAEFVTEPLDPPDPKQRAQRLRDAPSIKAPGRWGMATIESGNVLVVKFEAPRSTQKFKITRVIFKD